MDIKKYRASELPVFIIVSIIIICYFDGIENLDSSFSLDQISWIKVIQSAFVSSIIGLLAFILDSIIPVRMKDKFVFFCGPLPGETVFTRIASKSIDIRFTKEQSKAAYADIYKRIPTITNKIERRHFENSCWYALYQKYSDRESICCSQKDYLMCRDITCLALSLLFLYFISTLISNHINFDYRIICYFICIYCLSNISTRIKANRFVLNVIAIDLGLKTHYQ